MTDIKYVTGDATSPAGEGHKIVAHVCNDAGAWGAGFVLALSRKWPDTRRRYLEDRPAIRSVQYVYVEDDVAVVNMVAQRGLRSRSNPVPLDYDALDVCLWMVADLAAEQSASVHMPRIGCGLAGGKWERVEPLIKTRLCSRDIPVVVYDLVN